ncbi:MAG TPA: cysteine desulfurase, partial [Thermoplasmata archaeon]|nr:cysteine desulfurase [Thermoplasmata archaeon]
WHFVKDHKGAVLKYVDVNDDGTLKMVQYDDLLSKRTKIVTVALCSNVLGTINPVKEIVKRAHEVGAICVVDAAQAAPHMPIDVGDLDADFLAFSGHKMLGPTGIGILYGKPELLEATEPLLGGGEMIREVHLGSAKWNDVPYKFEGGTPNIAGAIGLGVAVDYLSNIGMEAVRAHEMEITEYALEKLGRLKGVRTFGPKDVTKRAGVVSFTIDNAHPHDIASILDVEGICVRSGHHCAQPLMERFGLPATARASFYIYNDLEDVDALVAGIKRVQEVFA